MPEDTVHRVNDDGERTEDALFSELGATGLNRWAGIVDEEPLQKLQGAKGIRQYKEMALNDPIVTSFLYALDTLVRQVKWEVEPPEDGGDGQEAVDFVKECMADMSHSWEDFISEVLSMCVYGWSGFEIVYKKRVGPEETTGGERSRFTDNKIGWRKLAIRSQDTLAEWVFSDEDGGVIGMIQQAPPDYKFSVIPIQKLLLFRTEGHKNNPEGKSLLRGAYRPWYFKKRIEEIEGIGIERDLAGLPVVKVPKSMLRADASAEDKEFLRKFKKMVANVRRNEQEGVVFPLEYDDNNNPLYAFELLSTGGRREFDTSGIITRYNQMIAMTVLADWLMLGHDAVGSYSLSSDKTDIFTMALGTVLNNIAAVVNRHAIPRLFAVNAMPLDQLPTVRPSDIEKPDLGVLGAFLKVLGVDLSLKLAEDPETIQYLRELAGLPRLEDKVAEEQATTQAEQAKAPPVPPPGMPGTPKPGEPNPAESGSLPLATNGNGKKPAAQKA